jgi:hypothetical protein
MNTQYNSSKSGGWSPRNIRPGGWLVILLILGAIYWYGIRPHMASFSGIHLAMPSLPGATSTNSLGSPQTGGGGDSEGDIVVLTTGTKKAWLQTEIDKFNGQSTSGHASMDVQESRDGMQHILAGAEKPDIWSPSSTTWTDRLAAIGPDKGISVGQSASDNRVLFQSPLVFLVVKSRLDQVRSILAGPNPFDHIARINQNGVHIRFGYADPLAASSGMLTMSLLLNEYANLHNSSDLVQVSESKGFAGWLGDVDKGLDRTDTSGSSALEQGFENDPAGRAFITAYESAALTAVAAHPELAIVYPSTTANATQVAATVDGPWTTPDRTATAKAFLDFISTDDAATDALQYYFRPAGNGGAMLAQRVASAGIDGYQEDYRAIDTPPYTAINNANVIWHNQH